MKNRWIAAASFIKGLMPKLWVSFSHFSGAKLKSTQIDLRVYNILVELIQNDKRQIICFVWPCRGVNNDATREEPFRSVTHSHARNLLKYTVLDLTASTIKKSQRNILLLLVERRKMSLCDTTKTSYANSRGICMNFMILQIKVL